MLATIRIIFNINKPRETIVETDVKTEALDELFAYFMHSQIGAGKDESKPNEKDVYDITIQINLEDDSLTIKSDTGNKGLTAGIVTDVWSRIDDLSIRGLSQSS